jgi:hypothetical protein
VLAILVAVGCGEPPVDGDDPPVVLPPDAPDAGDPGCDVDDDCPFGQVCGGGVCRAPTALEDEGCRDDSDCLADERCGVSTGQCVPDALFPDPPPPVTGDCADGDVRHCGRKVGACEYGEERCESGQWSGVCVGGVGPTDELCDDIDNDCDGEVDEDAIEIGTPCTSGLGECVRSGSFLCAAGGLLECDALPGLPQTEACDDLDNDCNDIVDNGCDDDGDNFCDANLVYVRSQTCRFSELIGGLDCNDNDANVRPNADEVCFDAFDQNCDGDPNDGCNCDPGIDLDFDGANQCVDCDDTNGAVRPGATERCDGIDNNCDLVIDEGFDVDGDTFTKCGTLPAGGTAPEFVDCNDNNADIHPGGCELCADGAGNTLTCGELGVEGNGVDEDCDGFLDENCTPCEPVDRDGDGQTECEGDCDNLEPSVFTGAPEICDGLDNDCNVNTVDNCVVGDDCDHPANTDECEEGLFCVESLGGGGNPTGNFTCTSSCNFSEPGLGLGDGCEPGQICGASLTPSANQHGCQVATDIGAGAVGGSCGRNDDCRSGFCLRDFRFTGNVRYCSDFCGADDYCGGGTVCANLGDTGVCRRDSGGTGFNGTCTFDAQCEKGACVEFGPGNTRCTDICCANSDCAGGFHCGVEGTGSPGPIGGVDTVPVCMPDAGGNGGRQAGAACSSNDECAGEFCDAALGVCVDVCCNDSTCPLGLTCEDVLVNVDLQDIGGQSFVRMCLNQTPADPLERVP